VKRSLDGRPMFVAMMRGINVAGHKPVKMETLRSCFQAMGFSGIQTYVQSGNVVFEATEPNERALAKKIETKLLRVVGFPITVILRTASELSRTVKSNPFSRERAIDPSRLHVTFLSEAPAEAARMGVKRLRSDTDRFHLTQREIYLYCPQGYGRTKLSNNSFERLLSVKATTRNWTTVNKLLQMVSLKA
jgi:uncharacterized protein (DUF1697 family)